MISDFQRDYLVRLPLPLAQLYARAHNAKSARDRHDLTYFLFEATVRLAVVPLISKFVEETDQGQGRSEKLVNTLTCLARPSAGHWLQMLRELSMHFGERVDGASHPLGRLWKQLTTKRRDQPACLALYRRIKNGPDGAPSNDQTFSFLDLFTALLPYRNGVIGHGAVREDAFYADEMAPLLFSAVTELLAEGALELLGPPGSRLVSITAVQCVDENEYEISLREIVGLQGERRAPISLNAKQAASLAPNCMAVLWPGRAVPLRLDPLLVYRESELADETLFLNSDPGGAHVEYLNYATGKTERNRLMAPAMAALMSRITGREIDDSEFDRLGVATPPGGCGEDAPDPIPKPTGRVLGDYEVLAELGSGAMGRVYLVRQLSLGRLIALKLLPLALLSDEVALARFRREIRVLAKCDDPHIVKIISSGTLPDGEPYYTMEYIPGCNLDQVWQEIATDPTATCDLSDSTWSNAVLSATRKLRQTTAKRAKGSSGGRPRESFADEPPPEVSEEDVDIPNWFPPLPRLPSAVDEPGGYVRKIVELVHDAAQALDVLHAQNAVHRDVKPANLMLTADGARIVLMDFGLVKGESIALTHSDGGFLGTMRYAAPEQYATSTQVVGPAADVRGLGVVTWELLTRRRLFADVQDVARLGECVLHEDVPLLRSVDRSLDRDLEAIVARATERRASERIQTAGELAGYLKMYLEGQPIPIRVPSLRELWWRWVGEHRGQVAAVLTALVLLTATIATALIVQYDSRKALERLVNERDEEVARTVLYATKWATREARTHEIDGDWPGAALWYAHAAQWEDERIARPRLLSMVGTSLDQYPGIANAWPANGEIHQLGVVDGTTGPVVVAVDEAGQAIFGGLLDRPRALDQPSDTEQLTLSPMAKWLAAIHGGEVIRWAAPFDADAETAVPDGFRVKWLTLSDDGSVVLTGQKAASDAPPQEGADAFSILRGPGEQPVLLHGPQYEHAPLTVISPDGAFVLVAANDAAQYPMMIWDVAEALSAPVEASLEPDASTPPDEQKRGLAPDAAMPIVGDSESTVSGNAVGAALSDKGAASSSAGQFEFSPQGNMIAVAGRITSLLANDAREDDAPDALPSTAGEALGAIGATADADFWAFTSPIAGGVTVEMEPIVEGDGGIYCIVAVLDEEFQVLVENDGGKKREQRKIALGYPLLAGKTYYVRARSIPNFAGGYRLRVRQQLEEGDSGETPELPLTRASLWHEVRREAARPSTTVVFDAGGAKLLTCFDEDRPQVWSLDAQVADLTLDHDDAHAGVFSHDGRMVATLGSRGVRVWSTVSGAPLTPLISTGGTPTAVAFDPSGRWLVVASRYEETGANDSAQPQNAASKNQSDVTMWDLRCGQTGFGRGGAAANCEALFPTPTGDAFLVIERDGTLSLLGADGNVRDDKIAVDQQRLGASVAEALAPGSSADRLNRIPWRPEGRSLLARFRRDPGVVSSLDPLRSLAEYSSPGRVLAVKISDHRVAICRPKSDRSFAVKVEPFPDQVVDDLSLSDDGGRLAVVLTGNPAGDEVVVWDRQMGRFPPISSQTRIHDADLSPDGERVVISDDNGVRIWSLEEAQPEQLHPEFDPSRGAPVFAARISRDGDKMFVIASAADEPRERPGPIFSRTLNGTSSLPDIRCEITWCNLATGNSLRVIARDQLIDALSYTIAGADRFIFWHENIVECWAFNGKRLFQIDQGEEVDQAAVSQDGARLLTWSPNGLLRVWDAQSGEPTHLPVVAPGRIQFAGAAANGDLWAVYQRTRLLRWTNRLASDDQEVVKALMMSRFRRTVEDKLGVLTPMTHLSGQPSALAGRREFANWTRRQLADCLAAEEWGAARSQFQRLESLTGVRRLTNQDRLLKAKLRLACGEWSAAADVCAEVLGPRVASEVSLTPDEDRQFRFLRGLARLYGLGPDDHDQNLDPNDFPGLAPAQRKLLEFLNESGKDVWRPIVAGLLAPEAIAESDWRSAVRSLTPDQINAVATMLCECAASADLPLSARRRAIATLPTNQRIDHKGLAALATLLTSQSTWLGAQLPWEIRRDVAREAVQLDLPAETLKSLLERLLEDTNSSVKAAARTALGQGGAE